MTSEKQVTISILLLNLGFDPGSGKVFRMFKGQNDSEPKEYELPINDTYLSEPFALTHHCPDFFAEDLEHIYFPVQPLPGEDQEVSICKALRSTIRSIPLRRATVRHGDEIVSLTFSKNLVVESASTVGGPLVVFWREARISAIADSVDLAVARVSLQIVNRLVAGRSPDGRYVIKEDLLINQKLKKRGVNAAIHYQEVPEEQKEPPSPPTLQEVYDRNTDPRFN